MTVARYRTGLSPNPPVTARRPGRPKRVLVVAPGTWGDVAPFVSVSQLLNASGFEAKLATHTRFEARARSAHVDIVPLPTDPEATLATPAGIRLMNTGSLLGRLQAMRDCFAPPIVPMARALDAFVDEADLILFSPVGVVAGLLARASGKPSVFVALQPFWPSRDYPSTLPSIARLPHAANLVSHYLADRVISRAFKSDLREVASAARRHTIEAESLSNRASCYGWLWRELWPTCFAFSESVVPRSADWPENVRVTGYVAPPSDVGWVPPENLKRALCRPEPKVVFTFGSMTPRSIDKTSRLIEHCAGALGIQAIVQSGWARLSLRDSSRVTVIGEAPHDWLFYRVDAVIHHGGAGTTASAIRAGVPSMATPFFSDQHFWGERIRTLGVGAAPIPHRLLRATEFTSSIAEIMSDAKYKERATVVSELIRNEDGAARLLDVITSEARAATSAQGGDHAKR